MPRVRAAGNVIWVGSLLLFATATARADDRSAADLLPESTIFYAEVPSLSEIVETIYDHPLRDRIEELDEYREATQTKEYLAFQGGREYVESQLGMTWREAIEGLTAQGVAVAFDPPTEGVAVLIRGQDEETLTHIVDVVMELARADAKNKGKDDPYEQHEYRGRPVYKTKDGAFTTIGDRFVAVNKPDLGRAIIDRILDEGAGEPLSGQKRFREAAKVRSHESLWAWVDIDWVRNHAAADDKPFQTQTDNPVGELLLGGLLDTFQETPWLTASATLTPARIGLQFETPHDDEWVTEPREYFFGTDGGGAAPAEVEIEDSLFSLRSYRDISAMWLRADDLFPENVVDGLAEADANLSLFFSGKDFGEDILGAFEPTVQIVGARQSFPQERPTPAIKLPAFAILFDMRDATTATRELRRTFTSFVGFANVTGAMEGNPALELDMPLAEGFQLVTSRFLPRDGDGQSREAPIHFNFSPTIAFAGKRCIIASTEGLARELAAAGEQASAAVNTAAGLNFPVLKELLADNESHLVSRNMLEEGHTREEAERQIELLLELVGVLQDFSLQLTTDEGRLGLDVELQLRGER